MAILLVLTGGGLAWAESALAEKLGCRQCHRFSAEDVPPAENAPDLHYAGNKFQPAWLLQFLQKPVVIRKTRVTSDHKLFIVDGENNKPHPSLDPQAAKRMVEYLSGLKLPGFAEGVVDTEPLSKGTRIKVKILFERNYSCIACHEGINLAGKPRGGISGPSLASAGNRLNADWLFNYLQTPEKFVEKRRMPRYQLDDETLGLLTRYLMSLQFQGIP
jgi:cytochrome c551/c552